MSFFWYLNHIAILGIVGVMCAVMLRLIWREAKVIKLNVNINGDLGIPGLHRLVDVGADKLLFSLIWRGSPKSISAKWDSAFLNAFVGRIHPPITAELLGREVSIIVDGRDDEMERSVAAAEDLPSIELYKAANDGSGFAKIKIVLFFGDSKQQIAAALRDEYAKQSDQTRSNSNEQQGHTKPLVSQK